MEHLALEIFDRNGQGSRYMMLPDDTVITINDTSEIFASGDVWSLSFQVNIRANAHIFGTSGDMHGSRLHEQVNKRRARLWVEGLPLLLGYLLLGDKAEVGEDGNIDISIESGQKTFDDMIEGAKANQVPLMSDIPIGMALLRERCVHLRLGLVAYAVFDNEASWTTRGSDVYYEDSGRIEMTIPFDADGENERQAVQQYPRMVFPKGDFVDIQHGDIEHVNALNTDFPYTEDENGTPTHPYCNVALCYQKYGYERKMENGEVKPMYNEEPEAQRGYEYMPANRVNSAPNFYVIYWLKALMKHLGIFIEENQMMDVEDLRRLFFVNTNCAYEEPLNEKIRNGYSERFGKYRFQGAGSLVPERLGKRKETIKLENSALETTTMDVGHIDWHDIDNPPNVKALNVYVADIREWDDMEKYTYRLENDIMFKAYATKECFPNVDIKEIISALESGFGIRFLFSDDFRRVRIVLLRNIFQSKEVQDIKCDIIEDGKMENSIRGFRMTYGNTEDTQFYYKGFADKLPHKKPYFIDDSDKHDYSHWDLDAEYGDIIKKISAFDKTCYVTPETGNAYIIKIDKDAKRYDELHPSLFEGAGFMDAEDGDCSGEEETIETVTLNFNPAIMNDVNFEDERDGKATDGAKQRFALFVDATMRPRREDLKDLPDEANQPGVKSYNDANATYDTDKLYKMYGPGSSSPKVGDGDAVKPGEFAITSDIYVEKKDLQVNIPSGNIAGHWSAGYGSFHVNFDIKGHINEGYRLYLQDNFEPNDDGISPIETKDWGLTLGIMRGSGSDAYVDYKGDPMDEEGNDTWELAPGSSATAHHDTCDNYGEEWDYNFTRHVRNSNDAKVELNRQYPNSNAVFNKQGTGCISDATIISMIDDNGTIHNILYATRYGAESITFGPYDISSWVGHSVNDIMAMDAANKKVIVEIDSSEERRKTLLDLCHMAYVNGDMGDIVIDENGIGSRYGRFSLKLRAEKPNPYYDQTIPEVVSTKEQAGIAMQKLYTTANTNLLTRPVVSNTTMRAAGWNAPGDGYATVYSMEYGVQYSDGSVREILWTPIKENGTVLTRAQLEMYISGFDGLPASSILSHDTQHLILDIGTTEKRADILHQLQAVYYAPAEETVSPVNVGSLRYLEIDDENLRRRGLCDQFYKEYSYWIRNARIAKRTVHMELADLLKLDKTKKVTVGDITGFIRKTQYSVSNKTGLGNVTMEIMYI